jgi:hypothetical protein
MVESNSPDLTPEKQLLKLIEDPNAKDIQSAKASYKTKSLFSFNFLKGVFSLFGHRQHQALHGRREFAIDISGINLALKLCIMGLAVYLAVDTFFSMQHLQRMPELFVSGIWAPTEKISQKPSEIATNIKSLSYYLDKVKARNIFSPHKEETAKEEPIVQVEKPKETPGENLAAAYNLVGISWSAEPDAIIEDTRTQRTYFLKRGDSFGRARVQAIFPDKVVLVIDGKETELK